MGLFHLSLAQLSGAPVPALPPLWREPGIGWEAAALRRSPLFAGEGAADGEGRPVMLIPGFLAGDASLSWMSSWLRRCGYRTHRAGMRMNVDCSAAACARLEEKLETMAARYGSRVAIVGQSRGGVYARVLAVQRPDLVSGIVTLGSPLRSMLSVHPAVLVQIGLIGALGALGREGCFTLECLRGECCARFRDALRSEFPGDVGFTSLYSKTDGIVNWRSCLDHAADERIEVHASHCGMSVNAECYAAAIRALERFWAADGPPLQYAEAA